MLTDRVTHFLDNQVNVALRIGDLPDSGLIATRLGAVRRVTCASPANLASRAAPAAPQDLADHDMISFGSVSAPATWRYWLDGKEVAVTLRSRLSVSTVDAAIYAGLAGAGAIRSLSCQVGDHVRNSRLRLLLEEFEPRPGRCTSSTTGGIVCRSSCAPSSISPFPDFGSGWQKSNCNSLSRKLPSVWHRARAHLVQAGLASRPGLPKPAVHRGDVTPEISSTRS